MVSLACDFISLFAQRVSSGQVYYKYKIFGPLNLTRETKYAFIEPLSVVPLNDEFQQARASVAKVEADVLLEIAYVINARATYSISLSCTYPDLFSSEDLSVASQLSKVKSKLYMPKAKMLRRHMSYIEVTKSCLFSCISWLSFNAKYRYAHKSRAAWFRWEVVVSIRS
ncbi:hypothetical protein Tco_1288500 [Tanacetum coccineum]